MRVSSYDGKLYFDDGAAEDRRIPGPLFQTGEDDDGQEHASDVDPEL